MDIIRRINGERVESIDQSTVIENTVLSRIIREAVKETEKRPTLTLIKNDSKAYQN